MVLCSASSQLSHYARSTSCLLHIDTGVSVIGDVIDPTSAWSVTRMENTCK